MPPLGPRDHHITLAQAIQFTARHRQMATAAATINAGAFLRDQVLELLNQAGCAGIRIYLGRDNNGATNYVAVGVDANGDDMTQGTILEVMWPCPPMCPPSSALNA